LNASGQPFVTYSSTSSGQWQTASLPGTATGILAAEAYQNAGEPSRLYLSGPADASNSPEAARPAASLPSQSASPPSSQPPFLDPARARDGSWTSAALPASPATLAQRVVLYAATASDDATALSAANAAGLPASQVTQDFATAWADTLSGDYLVIAVGLAA